MEMRAGAHAGPGEAASTVAGGGTRADAGAGADACIEFMDCHCTKKN